MDNALRNWLNKNSVISINIKKSGTTVYQTDGENPDDVAAQMEENYENLPAGNYTVLGRAKTGTPWVNAQTFFFEKKGALVVQNNNSSGILSHEQLQAAIQYERTKWEYERLLQEFNELKRVVKEIEDKQDKMAKALMNLLDDDDSNDKPALEKITDLVTVGKSMFGDLKIN